MVMKRRTDRLNSLLKEVLSEVVHKEIKDPGIEGMILSISKVDVSKDLSHAKVHVSIIGDEQAKKLALNVLNSAAGFISVRASKMVSMYRFPSLLFLLDNTVEAQMKIHDVIEGLQKERNARTAENETK